MPATIVDQREWAKGDRSKMVLTRGTWRKKDYIDLREHFLMGENGTSRWLPTKRGVRLSLDEAKNIWAAMATAIHYGEPLPEPKPTTRVAKRGKRGRAGWAPIEVCYECSLDQAHRYQHPLPKNEWMAQVFRYGVFCPSILLRHGGLDTELETQYNSLPDKTCCGLPMGKMPDRLRVGIWVYQCEANMKHSHTVTVAAIAAAKGE